MSDTDSPSPQLGDAPIPEIVDAMTTDEKIRLLVGMGIAPDIPGLPAQDPDDAAVPERVPGAAGRTHAINRLGIPSLTLADGPAGVRIDPVRDDSDDTYYATAFPVATLLASSWDPALLQRVGTAFGREARAYGIDVLLAPGMNIHRNPLGGRNFEYYSEDPLLSGQMAAAFVEGVQSEGVGTSIKHLVANNQETNRMQLDTVVSARALREIYLRGFRIAVEAAQPWTVMTAYNRVNGTYASQSRDLLTTILRDEWGFGGLVMTDWFAGDDPVAQVAAGNDLLMPGTPDQTEALTAADQDGSLDHDALDASVARMLQMVLRSPTFRGVDVSNAPPLDAHADVARQAAADGMVLLKNAAGTLPLDASQRVALFGNASYDLITGGTGSGDVHAADTVSLDAGLEAAGATLDASLRDGYADHLAEAKAHQEAPPSPLFLPPPLPEWAVGADRIQDAAQTADVAILTLGRRSGEFDDRTVDDDFRLTDTEQTLIRDVSDAFHARGKPVVAVLNVGGVVEVARWREAVDALLVAWQPGQEGGHAIADVLRGAVAPSGKLPMTFPVHYADVPSADSFPGTALDPDADPHPMFGTPAAVTYREGLYVGYRYFTTFDVAPAYPFGHGLSYTDFAYSDLTLERSATDDALTGTVTVTNTGDTAGREVVQVYVSVPEGLLDTPERELRAFAKTDRLAPGDAQTISFALTPADVASYDPDRAAWVVAAGTYTVRVGASSEDIRQRATFSLSEQVARAAHSVIAPPANEAEFGRPPLDAHL